MNSSFKSATAVAVLALAVADIAYGASAKALSDILPPQRRQATVEMAQRLAQRKPLPPVDAELPSPFNPPDFDKPDPKAPGEAGLQGATPVPGAPAAAPGPATDRETLELLAAQIKPSGTFEFRGKSLLMINDRPFEVGTRFTASYNNQEYELELVAIDRTSFTLRYRNEEITRPIQRVR